MKGISTAEGGIFIGSQGVLLLTAPERSQVIEFSGMLTGTFKFPGPNVVVTEELIEAMLDYYIGEEEKQEFALVRVTYIGTLYR